MPSHVYREKNSRRIPLGLGIAFVLFIFSFTVSASVRHIDYVTETKAVDFVIPFCISFVVFFAYYFLCGIQIVEITATELKISSSKNKKSKSVLIQDIINAKSIKNYYNGIYTGTTRVLYIKNESRRNGKEEINLRISKEDFNLLMADISNIRDFGALTPKPEKTEYDAEGIRKVTNYTIETRKKEFLVYYKRALKSDIILSSAIFATVLVVMIVLLIVIKSRLMNIYFVIIIISTIAILLLKFIITPVVFIRKIKKDMPTKIILRDKDILIDDLTKIAASDIKGIYATPPAYTLTGIFNNFGMRRILIDTNDGRIKLCFGPRPSDDLYLREYDNFLGAFHIWCNNNRIVFREELE